MTQPLYDTTDYGRPAPANLASIPPTVWQSARTAFRQAWQANPSQAFVNAPVLAGEDFFDGAFDSTTSDTDIVKAIADGQHRDRKPGLPLEEQQARIEAAGLAQSVTPDPAYSEEALTLIIDSGRLERSASLVSQAAPAWHLPFSLAASFAAGLCDPVNIASAFVPLLGEQRVMALLGTGRMASAAISGAASGATAQAALEPLLAANRAQLQADYTAVNSLLNISLGALLGSAAHSLSTLAPRQPPISASRLQPDAAETPRPVPQESAATPLTDGPPEPLHAPDNPSYLADPANPIQSAAQTPLSPGEPLPHVDSNVGSHVDTTQPLSTSEATTTYASPEPPAQAQASRFATFEEAQASFETALADINTRRWEKLFIDADENVLPAPPKSPAPAHLDELAELTAASRYAGQRLDRALETEQLLDREALDMIAGERQSALGQIDAEMTKIGEQQQVLESFLACVL